MQIREATAADDELVARMRVRFLGDHRGVDELPAPVVAATGAFVTERGASGALLSWLAEEDDACIGIVSLVLHDVPPHPEHRGDREGLVVNMYVDPAHRGAGVGRALLGALHEHAGDLGLRRLTLHATAAGRPMYERLGFTTDDTWMQLPL